MKEVQLKATNAKLTSYTGEQLPVLGQCQLKYKDKILKFFVVDTEQVPILGLQASKELNLFKLVMNVSASERENVTTNGTKEVIRQFPEVFQGLGCLEKPYHIQIDSKITPVVNQLKSQPVALRDRLKQALEEMEMDGVIKKVDQPTEWVNSVVVVEKPGSKKLRICLDPRPLNEAIQREHYKMPTIEEITTRVAGATVFSKLDANHGYRQVPLDEESQLLTTFNTEFGRYCYKRMPFGIKSAQEVFQKRMSQSFGDLEGVETDVDDILVWGTTAEEHDHRLKKALQRCQEINLTLNESKCEFGTTEVVYIGHKLAAQGVKLDESKVDAINKMPQPTCKKDAERLLGMVNYFGKFIPQMSMITDPIRKVMKSDVEFKWGKQEEEAFRQIKEILTAAPVLAYYDVKRPVTITCDASKSGLGAVLLQEGKPVAYASKALTDAETRYAQIEKELLAVVFGFERFYQYTYARHVEVETDHKPLEAITKKPLSMAPPRLQRMLLRLQRYDFTAKYKPGKEMVLADTLSRAFIPEIKLDASHMENEVEYHAHSVLHRMPVSTNKMEKIREETSKDPTMMILLNMIHRGWPQRRRQTPVEIQEFWNYRDEMSEIDGVVMKGDRIVIPATLRSEMLARVHDNHLGIEKCRRRARDIIFWPQMNRQIDEMISKCDVCQEYQSSNPKEPMVESPLPSRPWELVATDLFHWEQRDFLLVVDYYSRYVEVVKLDDIKSRTVVNHTKSIVARHGIPSVFRSDNGPQYSAQEYQQFSKEWKFEHQTSSPYYPKSNGLAEKAVQTVKMSLTKAKADGKDPYLSLLEYRNTPIDDVGSPAQLLMSRRLQSILPNTLSQLQPSVVDPRKVEEKLKKKQERQKKYYDVGSRVLPSLQHGEMVRVQVGDQWKKATVKTQVTNPRSYNLKMPRREVRRNRVHIRRQNGNTATKEPIEDGISESRGDNETTLPNLSQSDQKSRVQNTKWSSKQTTGTLASRNLKYDNYSEELVNLK